ncbi:MAG: DUF362 domain-containing protein [Actinomycetota bacterium]|nr:DUF362 domain-containing protein [Actinomycetota bacterium]
MDRCELVKKFNDNALAYRQIYLPRVLFEDYYFISVPVLKAHTITRVTLSYKNLVGLLAQKHYGGYWHYRRSDVHRVGVEKAIYDLSNYVPIDLAIIDAATGQADSHLRGGKACSPPHRKIVGGHRILEVDQAGCRILGVDPETVKHLSLIEKALI